jgi:hypothetical protein
MDHHQTGLYKEKRPHGNSERIYFAKKLFTSSDSIVYAILLLIIWDWLYPGQFS